MTKLLVVGATGLVGSCVVEQALADVRISQVIALTRRPIATRGRLENIVIDFSNMPDQADWWSVDGVVSALGTTRATTRSRSDYRSIDYEYPLAIARHARDHGATRFALTSSLGANPGSRFAYTRTKGELEVELQKLGFPSLTIVRPSVLQGDREHQRADERAAQIIAGFLAPILPRRLRISPASAVAALLINGVVQGLQGVHLRSNKDMPR
ncbi:NAD-dependent epimerase/dehydratase family protein [Sphingomonas gei]|uniref:NAD-dependent epimerase/dehydratase family protein n=1 Tax=Sphingomonas gei TaxID=1395960 RepID=A0A4S1X2A4_9SPHN|nr:NAD(P)H-binding protein [Sphingomonas gei]TGX49127.1 NAD-dependent epimerase/dehydratase family protein [Sphingomonas gei]